MNEIDEARLGPRKAYAITAPVPPSERAHRQRHYCGGYWQVPGAGEQAPLTQ